MPRRLSPLLPILLAVLAVATGCAAERLPSTGYLARDRAPDVMALVPAPPAPGSAEDAADRAAFLAGRALRDGPRWTLAQADDELVAPPALQRFDCAVGASLARRKPPALTRLFNRVLRDVQAAWEPLKTAYPRPRPPAVYPTAPICLPRLPQLVDTPAWPSGHAAAGRAWALILAELAPDRAPEILKRGDQFGDSRLVCGMQWVSDVEAGRRLGEAVFAAEAQDPGFRADLEAARVELAAIRARGETNAACTAEAAALATPLPAYAGRGETRSR
jgi:acid phosphatase (class A)